MSRFSGMSSAKRRAWGVGVVLFFIVLCGTIAFAQWWAVTKNVPKYERINASHSR